MPAKYDRIAAELRGKIASGKLRAGEQLPVELDIARNYGVSLSTVRRALEVLQAEGLVEKQHGTGTFVREKRQRLLRTTDRYQWEKDRARLPDEERGKTGATEYDTGLELEELAFEAEYEEIEADEDLAQAMAVPVDTPILRRFYATRKASERAPLGVGTSYLVRAMIESNPKLLDVNEEPWPGGTQHQLSTVGIEIDKIVDQLSARPATVFEAEMLDVKPGACLLALRKISIDTDERVVEIADIIWPGDRIEFHYSTQLARWPK